MGRVVYSMSVSLDGFMEAPGHDLGWTLVDEELHRWFNEEARGQAVFLYGRRLYELMEASWPTVDADPALPPWMAEFARIWCETPKIVFSRTLEAVAWNSRLVRGDAVAEIARLRAETDGELSIGGARLAATAIRAGLVDGFRLVVHPVVLGRGTPFFPALEAPVGLRLVETRAFGSGAVLLSYEIGR